MLNKKSQEIVFGMLVIFAIVLCSVAIYSFFTFGKNTSANSDSIFEASRDAEFNKQYDFAQTKILARRTFSKCSTCSSEEFKEIFKQTSLETENLYKFAGAGNLYGKIRAGEFDVVKEESQFRIKIDGLFVQAEKDFNKITKNFDICLRVGENSVRICQQ